jgi:LDH2 family malate/lactate/ureidoglycolate dehydrogenase
MNKRPIETANDADLRMSQPAMQRAVQRAWKLAMQTGTAIVISHQGVIEHFRPSATASAQIPRAQEPTAPYGDKA